MKSIAKKLFKESSIYSLQPIFEKMVGILLIPIYTAYLTPADYGILQYITTIGAFLLIIISGGLDTSFWKFRTIDRQYSKGEVALNAFLTKLVFGFGVVIVFYLITISAYKTRLGTLILVFIIGKVVSIIYQNILLILRANHKPIFYIILTAIYTVCLAVSNIIFIVYFRMNYEGIIYSNLIINILLSFGFFYVLSREFKGRPNFKLSLDMIKYGSPLVIGNIAGIIISLSDRFFLKAYSTDHELGLYSFGCQFGNLVSVFLITPFFLGWNSIRWEIYEMKEAKEIFVKIYKALTLILPIAALIITSIAVFVGTVMTKNKEYLAGFSIISVIAFSQVLYGLYYFNAMGMLFENKTMTISNIILISSGINIILNFVLIPYYGMIGASLATLISYFAMFSMSRFFCQKYYYFKRNTILEISQICFLFLISIVSIVVYKHNFFGIYMFPLFIFLSALFLIVVNVITRSIKIKDFVRIHEFVVNRKFRT